MNSFWDDKKVVVTGGAGFVGSHVIDNLLEIRKVARDNLFVPRSKDFDLRHLDAAVKALERAEVVLHLAGTIGGIGFSSEHQATQLYDCSLVSFQVAEAARINRVKKVVFVSSSCAYPLRVEYPMTEEMIFYGLPQETNRGYGYAKRLMIPLAEAYLKEHGLDIAVVIPNNTYGPRDNFDKETSHVIPSTIRKCFEGRELVVWGDGTPTRDFFYVEDFAEGVVLATEKLPPATPVNLGSGVETSIKELVELIVELTDYKGPIKYDTTKPKGQPRRSVSIELARKLIGFEPKYTLREGLKKTIEWYRENIHGGGSPFFNLEVGRQRTEN